MHAASGELFPERLSKGTSHRRACACAIISCIRATVIQSSPISFVRVSLLRAHDVLGIPALAHEPHTNPPTHSSHRHHDLASPTRPFAASALSHARSACERKGSVSRAAAARARGRRGGAAEDSPERDAEAHGHGVHDLAAVGAHVVVRLVGAVLLGEDAAVLGGGVLRRRNVSSKRYRGSWEVEGEAWGAAVDGLGLGLRGGGAVSYTHLTLPTIYSV